MQEEGLYVASSNGYQMPHPAVKIARDAKSQMHHLLVQFGFTPASRSRINVSPPQPAEEETLVDPNRPSWRSLRRVKHFPRAEEP